MTSVSYQMCTPTIGAVSICCKALINKREGQLLIARSNRHGQPAVRFGLHLLGRVAVHFLHDPQGILVIGRCQLICNFQSSQIGQRGPLLDLVHNLEGPLQIVRRERYGDSGKTAIFVAAVLDRPPGECADYLARA